MVTTPRGIAVFLTLAILAGIPAAWLSAQPPAESEQPERPATPEDATLSGKSAGEVREFTDLKIKMCWCPAGRFKMGSPASDTAADRREKPQVEVTLSRGFWLGQTEVTQGLWETVMGTRPWAGKVYTREGASYPATYVSHGLQADGTVEKDSATEFCRRLTARERAAGRLPAGWEYRLPTEAQWEYACRAGTTSKFSFGDDAGRLGEHAWFDKNAWDVDERYAHQAGLKRANPWGLFDMHGNMWEWCSDWYAADYYAKSPSTDPAGPSSGSGRVSRGGGWSGPAGSARSAYRSGYVPSNRERYLGFRLALSPSGE
jgi:formylglycine-generating enzyme required for sulfatase activity